MSTAIDPTVSEEALLGACILNNKAALIATEYVTASDFVSPSRSMIFDAIIGILATQATVDPAAICSFLGNRCHEAGGSSYIFTLSSMCPVASNVREYAKAVRDASLDRQVRKSMRETAEQLSGRDLLLGLQESLYQMDRPFSTGSTLRNTLIKMQSDMDIPASKGCEYPWSHMQYLTRGMRPGWLCILAGEASVGKTCAALQVIRHNLKQGKKVLLLSQEMSAREVAIRFAQQDGFSCDRYYEERMNDDDRRILKEISQEPYWDNLYVERAGRVSEIPLYLRRWRPDLLVVDHLQLLAGAEKVETLSQNTRNLKLMAEKFSIPFLVLSQLSRAQEQDRDKIPKLYRLRGSGTIEQDADTVLFVWRKRDHDSQQMTNESALVVSKVRMGRLGACRALFDGERQRFTAVVQGLGGEEWMEEPDVPE